MTNRSFLGICVLVCTINTPALAQPLVCGCQVVGENDGYSVELLTAAGETLSGRIGGELMWYTENNQTGPLTVFAGAVHARTFAATPPVFVTGNITVTPDMMTVVVNPDGDTAVVSLPVALYQPGQRVTIKQLGQGAVDVHGAFSWYLQAPETIDGSPSYMLPTPVGSGWPAVTLEAWVSETWPYRSGWVIVGAYQ